ncbi:RES domain-containing protein [Dyella lutea]|uniref:RES domain-containing protein n=1 Tax=Dyella lutea TaxID=2950441 RepID=A0ABT1FCE3_9GAMM|nr:RES domain-containing protein [Dyella lutea]MCP1375051.1 RES domain-containing protein [Dyella lutea]
MLDQERLECAQAVADFLATHPRLSLDGILFKSVQHDGGQADAGRNVVLFNKASRVEGSGRGADGGVERVSLFEFDEDGDYWFPSITLKKPEDIEPEGAMQMEADTREVALQMHLGELQVSAVKSAEYRTDDEKVRVSRPR